MAKIEKRIVADNERDIRSHFYQIIKLPEKTPLFSNDILDFFCPLGSFPGYEEGYDIGICSIKKQFSIFNRMERHLDSCEILIPINEDMFVPMAPPGDVPVTEHIRLVPVNKGELICMNEGVWHFAAGPIKAKALDYFVILKTSTPETDLEMKDLDDTIVINT